MSLTPKDLHVGDRIEYNAYSVLRFIGEVIELRPIVKMQVETACTTEGQVRLASTGQRPVPVFAFEAGQVRRLS